MEIICLQRRRRRHDYDASRVIICFDVESNSTGCCQIWCLLVCSDPSYPVVVNPFEKRLTAEIDQSGATVMSLALRRTNTMFPWMKRPLFNSIPVSDLRRIRA
jgi:hypothetical protein